MTQERGHIMNRVEEAVRLHASGCNCAQAVALAFADLTGLTREELFKLTEPFGSGMAGMQGICGAVSGAGVITGLLTCDGDIGALKTRKESYHRIKEIEDRFRDKAGSIICKEIKGVGTGKVLMSCSDCVRNAAGITCELLDIPEETRAD